MYVETIKKDMQGVYMLQQAKIVASFSIIVLLTAAALIVLKPFPTAAQVEETNRKLACGVYVAEQRLYSRRRLRAVLLRPAKSLPADERQ